MKKIFLMLLIVPFLLMGCSEEEPVTEIKAARLDEFMEEHPDYVYIDVRTAEEFAEYSVEGFENIEQSLITSGEVVLDKEETYVVLCRSGRRSAAVVAYLTENGYTAIDVVGGVVEYIAATN